MFCDITSCDWNKEKFCTRKYIVIILDNDNSINNFICCSSNKEDFITLEDTIAYGTKGYINVKKAPNPQPIGSKLIYPPAPPKKKFPGAHYIMRYKDYNEMDSWRFEYLCSNCDKKISISFKFCPECGARFDGVKDK